MGVLNEKRCKSNENIKCINIKLFITPALSICIIIVFHFGSSLAFCK